MGEREWDFIIRGEGPAKREEPEWVERWIPCDRVRERGNYSEIEKKKSEIGTEKMKNEK